MMTEQSRVEAAKDEQIRLAEEMFAVHLRQIARAVELQASLSEAIEKTAKAQLDPGTSTAEAAHPSAAPKMAVSVPKHQGTDSTISGRGIAVEYIQQQCFGGTVTALARIFDMRTGGTISTVGTTLPAPTHGFSVLSQAEMAEWEPRAFAA